MTEPEVTRVGLLDMQICVPKAYTDEQVLEAAETLCECGTTGGWHIRREGDPALCGAPERMTCANDPDNVHVMLDA